MRGRRLTGDAGAATTETVIVAPLVLFTLLLIVQLGLYFHAINVASTAAQEGAHEASLRLAAAGGETDPAVATQQGEDAAQDFVDQFASELLAGVQVTGDVTADDQLVRMTVSGDVKQTIVIPGIDFAISVDETAQSPVERFRPAGEAPVTP